MGRVVTFGEIMLRLAPNGYYRFFQTDQLQATFGGAEANTAVCLANFGDEVSFVSKIPPHAIGQGVVNALRSFGVDVSFVKCGGDRLGIYYLEKGANQRGSICIYDRKGSAIALATRDDFDWGTVLENTDWFHFTGITPALGYQLVEICEEACIEAKKNNITVSCDLNYRSKLWSREEAKKAMTRLSQYVDVCIANEEDAKNVFGIEAYNSDVNSGQLDKSGYVAAANELKSLFGFKEIAFSLRTSHSATVNDWAGMLFDGKQVFYSKEYHIDNIVDRVGSGDSFAAGLIYALHHGFSGQEVIDFAVAASALKHSIEGDFNRVNTDEVIALMEGTGSGRVQR